MPSSLMSPSPVPPQSASSVSRSSTLTSPLRDLPQLIVDERQKLFRVGRTGMVGGLHTGDFVLRRFVGHSGEALGSAGTVVGWPFYHDRCEYMNTSAALSQPAVRVLAGIESTTQILRSVM
jgi:hypothetical protein